MKGYIYTLYSSTGLITKDDDNESIFFIGKDLKNCNIRQLEEGDSVEFDIGKGRDGGPIAINIRKLHSVSDEANKVRPGMHPSCDLSHYNSDEKRIITKLSNYFYITSGGEEICLGKSNYDYCIIKPTDYYTKTFKLKREIAVVFADYVSFEPRSLDVASAIYKRVPSKLRLDRGCHILISHDSNFEAKLIDILKDSNLNQIVIPFTYEELLSTENKETFIQNRFKKYLFDTDLFSEVAPIQEDVFFFGRRDFAFDIASKCKNSIHSGVFGLRRSGKTSLLYAVQRLLNQQSYPTVFIPCESDLFNLDWKTALCKVVRNVYQEIGKDASRVVEDDYRGPDATIFFEEDLHDCLKNLDVPVTLMFDEIEAITFDVAQGEEMTNLWCDGMNFVNFWNAIKGYYSKYPTDLSILIAGTNPMINEVPIVGKKKTANPMFGQLSQSNQGAYLRAFSEEDTRNMVNTLGGYMGLSFNDHTIASLVSDCGGHPYLMRMMCSCINRYMRRESISRPAVVSKAIYEKAAPEFEKSNEATTFYWMILNILMTHYPKEFESLKILALEGDDYIAKTQDSENLPHLIGYGLIEHNQGNYAVSYNTIYRFLRGEYKFERKGLTIEEQKEEIQLRINRAEMQLRKLTKNILLSSFGKNKAKQIVLEAMKKHKSIDSRTISKAENLEYTELFDTSQNNMYFSLLTSIISNNYNVFGNIFENKDEKEVNGHMRIINQARRCPDHSYTEDAKNWSWDRFEQFRESISWLESVLAPYE